MSSRKKLPLNKITVVDLSRLIPGPFCSLILRELGARVIKVKASSVLKPEEKLVSHLFNDRKEYVVIDYKNKEGAADLLTLIKDADVVLESFRPGVMKKLGFSFKKLSKINSKIILASITGYGQTGQNRHLAGHDLNYMALAGLISSEQVPSMQWADFVGGGVWGALAIVLAILNRSKNKKAIHLDISMTDAMIYMGLAHLVIPQLGGSLEAITGKLARYRLYETKDHRFVALAALESKFWNPFCEAIQKPEWKQSSLAYPDRAQEIHRELEALFKSKTLKEWIQWNQGKDICLTPVLNSCEVTASEQFKGSYLNNKIVFPRFPLSTAWGKIAT